MNLFACWVSPAAANLPSCGMKQRCAIAQAFSINPPVLLMDGAQYGMGYYVKKFADFGMYNKVWLGFVFMVIVMVIVMQLFEKLKDRLLKWTIS